jgi:hypothetical protein
MRLGVRPQGDAGLTAMIRHPRDIGLKRVDIDDEAWRGKPRPRAGPPDKMGIGA